LTLAPGTAIDATWIILQVPRQPHSVSDRLLVKLLGHLTNFPLYLYLAHSKTLWLVKYTNHLLQIFTPNSQLHIYYKNLQTKTIWYRKSNTQNNKDGNGLHIETNGIRLGSTH
jgi:hypothetical protein